MTESIFTHTKVKGIVSVIPENFIQIDDEIIFFANSQKKLDRAKKIVGFGKRHIVPDGITVVDLCEAAGNKLLSSMNIAPASIDALILVNQSPDYFYPASSCILHGKIGLNTNCATFDVALGCSGYVYGLWLAHSLISSGAVKNCLLLAGDTPSTHSDKRNRVSNPLFGDAASATYLEWTEDENPAYFSMGTDGSKWDRIVVPAGGRRLPIHEDIINMEIKDALGNIWHPWDEIIHGMDVFNFTMDVVPKNILNVLHLANKKIDDISFFAIHQANKQIVENIISKIHIPSNKSSSETFSKYGNNSTTSVATVICDILKDRDISDVVVSGFGVGLSWGSAILNLSQLYNGGIEIFKVPNHITSRTDQIEYWVKQFKEK